MRTGMSFHLSAADRLRLETLVRDRNTPQKHVGAMLYKRGGGAAHGHRRAARAAPQCLDRCREQ
jgi:hypothetical protein